jgi:mannitol-1-phosphate/altronate dehydrogenase
MAGIAKYSFYKEHEEIARRKREKEYRRQEQARLREKAKIESLLSNAAVWGKCVQITKFIDAVEQSLSNNSYGKELQKNIEEWISWARLYVTRSDPIKNLNFLQTHTTPRFDNK